MVAAVFVCENEAKKFLFGADAKTTQFHFLSPTSISIMKYAQKGEGGGLKICSKKLITIKCQKKN